MFLYMINNMSTVTFERLKLTFVADPSNTYDK